MNVFSAQAAALMTHETNRNQGIRLPRSTTQLRADGLDQAREHVMTDESSAMRQPYKIVSVRRAARPPGAEGSNWHRYVIAQGANVIHGYRRGNLRTVTLAVEEIVAQLNERRSGKRGEPVQMVIRPKK